MRRRLRNSAGVEAGSWRNTPFLFSDPAKVFVRRTRGPAWRSLRCVPVSAPLQPVIGDEETLKRGMLEKRWFATLPFFWSRPVAAAGKGGAGPGGGIGGVGCAGGRAASCGAGAASGFLCFYLLRSSWSLFVAWNTPRFLKHLSAFAYISLKNTAGLTYG